MSRWIVVATVAGWTLGCLLPPRNDDQTTEEPFLDEPLDGTVFEGLWTGTLDCPSGEEASVSFHLPAAEGLTGSATLLYNRAPHDEDVVYQTVSITSSVREEEPLVSDLGIETSDCYDHSGVDMDCPLYFASVWDQRELPAVIEGEIPERDDPSIPCTFVLHAAQID